MGFPSPWRCVFTNVSSSEVEVPSLPLLKSDEKAQAYLLGKIQMDTNRVPRREQMQKIPLSRERERERESGVMSIT